MHGNILNKNKVKLFNTANSDLAARISILENNVYKITYYEIISGASGTLTVPTAATINANEFSGANCILSEIDVNNKPTWVSPKDAGGTVVTATLNTSTGAWVKSGVTVSANVALIYSLNIRAADYFNLTNFYIIDEVVIGDFNYVLNNTTTATVTSALLKAAMSDETGSGALVFGTSPTFTTQIDVNGLVNVVRTTEQMRLAYDVSNYYSTTVSNVGNTTFALTGTNPSFNFRNTTQIGDGTMIGGTLRGMEISYASQQSNIYIRNNLTSSKSTFLIGDATYAKSVRFQYCGSAFATSGIEQADSANLFSVATKLNIGTYNSYELTFWTNDSQRAVMDTSGNLVVGAGTASARLHAVSTTEQLRVGYDASNYVSHTVSSTGNYTVNLTGSASTKDITLSASNTRVFLSSTSTGASAYIGINTNGLFFSPQSGIGTWFYVSGVLKLQVESLNLVFADAYNMQFNTTTGTKIGTATTQKIGFWNATPIVQPTTAVAAATFVANTSGIANDTATFDGYTIGQVVKALRNTGLLA